MEPIVSDNSEEARARAWLDLAQGKWRLQTMQHRSRFNPKTGEYKRLPTRIRRFLNGTPAGLKTAVLSLLRESAPYRTPVFDAEVDADLEYVPTNTFIRKDGPEHTTGGKDATYTIIQDLLLKDEAGDTFGFADESSCAQAGETEYHWDEPDVADCPDGSQGVSYQVTDVSRDRDTDLFSYRVRKVQALTVHVPPQVEECSARRRVTVESWDNLYGEPGAFRQDPVRGGSAAVEVPEACSQPDGRTVKVDVARNADCTYRVTVQTADAVTDDGLEGPDGVYSGAVYSVYRDQYKANLSKRVVNAFDPLPKEGVEYDGGVTTKYTSERNEDGTWNNSVDTETERPVSSSTTETAYTPRGTRTTRVDTNQASPAAGISSQFGSFKATKTPGGLYNNEYVEYSRRLADNLGLTCSDDLFTKTHETQSSVDAVPPAGTHVPPAAGGLVTTYVFDTDAEGFVTRRERTEQEHAVENAVTRTTRGFLGTATSVQHRSVTAGRAAELENGAGAPGTTIEVRRTKGDLRDVEVQTFTKSSGHVLGYDCSKTVFQHVHEKSVSAASASAGDVSNAGGGRTYQRTFSVDPQTGAVTKRERTTSELTVPSSRRSVRVTARGTVTSVSAANSATHPADPAAKGSSLEWEVTPGGRYNYTSTTTRANVGNVGVAYERDKFLSTDSTTAMQTSAPSAVSGGSGGKYGERQARLGDDGLWEVTTAEHSERKVDGEVHVTVTSRAHRRTTTVRQTPDAGAEPQATVADAGKEYRKTATRGGLWTVESTVTTALEGNSSIDCERDLFVHRHSTGHTASEADDAEALATVDMSGVYRSRSQRLGDDGLWSITDTESAEQDVAEQTVDERVTRYGLVKRTTDVQVTSEGTPLAASANNVGKERRVEKTRGGRRNVTTTTVSPLYGSAGTSCEKTAFLHSHTAVELSASTGSADVSAAAAGSYQSKSATLTELGTWEVRTTTNTEEHPSLQTQQYQDAFGSTEVTEEFSNASSSGGRGGKQYQQGTSIQSVEASLTNGGNYTVRTKKETAVGVDSGWLNFSKTTDKGLAVYYDFIVFRNKKSGDVSNYVSHIQGIEYNGGDGSYANHPSISISPNRFGLWDGTVALTTTFTPKTWASGGSNQDDNWEKDNIKVKSVSFMPVAGGKLLRIVTEETHKKGGGVGKDRLESVLSGGVIRGSQFSFHPSGQSFSYDIITAVSTKGTLEDMPKGSETKDLWNGS